MMYKIIKRLFDFCAALIGSIITLPFFILIAIAIKLDSKGPVFFIHHRVGKNGKTLPILKFRTMVVGAENMIKDFTPEQKKEWETNFKLEHDPRVTRIGHFLRKTSIDELPQLYNILAGQLSVVGPRPVTEEEIEIKVEVTNLGQREGKEVVQIYYSAPQGKLGKPALELGAFQKTRLLAPGETQTMRLSVPVSYMASFDDLGKISRSAYVLEAGTYSFYVGNSSENLKKWDQEWNLSQDKVLCRLTSKCAPCQLPKRLTGDGSYEMLPVREAEKEPLGLPKQDKELLEGMEPADRGYGQMSRRDRDKKHLLSEVTEGKLSLDEFMKQLSVEELAELLGGQPNTGVANTYGMGNLRDYGVPNVMTADGPAGLRIQPQCHVYTTAWPCATMLACTWNPDLVEEIGAAGASEVKENNIGIWLTPAMNIHRSPLCGRNFEYYSEDPLIAGKMGAAMVRGIQSQHIAASVKHFACNNKESNRKDSDSRVSERALREIYLKGFEIVVKEGDPWTIMSSYNLINGQRASENKDLLTGILREEWGFKGIVTTDWWTRGEHYKETKAGNDIKMGCGYPDRLLTALEKGLITREEMEVCARRILEMILKLD